MISRDLLTQTIYEIIGTDLLATAVKVDSRPNSLQIKGRPEVKTVALGVSASAEFITQAMEANADYLITHHGLKLEDHMGGSFVTIENRLKTIIKNELSLASFHYSLDAHNEIGNNAQIAKKLVAYPTGDSYFDNWGLVAEFASPIFIDDLVDRLQGVVKHDVLAYKNGPTKIKRLGICSGGARPNGSNLMEIITKNIDVHITGEISESNPYIAKELGFNYLAAGHYATEVFGVQALGQKLLDRFGINVQVKFIDTKSNL